MARQDLSYRSIWRSLKHPLIVVVATGCMSFWISPTGVRGFESLGVGTESLLGGDLTDPEDDGDPEADDGYNAIFDASHEPGFGSENEDLGSAGVGESAFNVFDNVLGPANDKWCCGDPLFITEDEPIWVSAQFPSPVILNHFTVSSANDAPNRDPIFWAMQGSNDGENYTDIYVYEDDFGPWFERLEVILFASGDTDDNHGNLEDDGEIDFPLQTEGYTYFRLATYDTINNQNGVLAYFQIGEIELFGEMIDGGGDPGDFNMNGMLDAGDIDDLSGQVAGGTNPGGYDLNGDAVVDTADMNFWIEDLFRSWIGDANLDGEFNSGDLVAVLAAGAYEQDVDAVWTTGDFTGDGRANSSDLVAALSGGGYEAGPRAAVASVPEPSTVVLTLLGLLGLAGTRRRQNG